VKRPETLSGKTIVLKVGCGFLKITLNHKDDDRYNVPPINEIFINPEFAYKDDEEITAYCCNSFLQPFARLLTWQLRRLDEKERASFLRQIILKSDAGCPRMSVAVNRSCIDAVGRALLCHWEGHKFKDGRCYVCKLTELVPV